MKNKKMRKIGMTLLTTVLLFGATGMTSFAQTNEVAQTEEVIAEQSVSQITEQKTEEQKDKETAFSTPGNGQLVDDKGNDSTKQFLTIKTKKGNTFYMIIDRAGATENVYMMSLVDENDLAEFVDESMASDNKEPDVVLPETTEESEQTNQTKPDTQLEEIPEKEQKNNQFGYVVLGGSFLALGIGVFVFFYEKLKKKKEEGSVEEGLEYMEATYINEEKEQEEEEKKKN